MEPFHVFKYFDEFHLIAFLFLESEEIEKKKVEQMSDEETENKQKPLMMWYLAKIPEKVYLHLRNTGIQGCC